MQPSFWQYQHEIRDGAEKILLLGAPEEDPFEPLEVSPLTTNLLDNETAPVAELFNELFFVPLQEDIDPFVIFVILVSSYMIVLVIPTSSLANINNFLCISLWESYASKCFLIPFDAVTRLFAIVD